MKLLSFELSPTDAMFICQYNLNLYKYVRTSRKQSLAGDLTNRNFGNIDESDKHTFRTRYFSLHNIRCKITMFDNSKTIRILKNINGSYAL